jgi:hypothetical protein
MRMRALVQNKVMLLLFDSGSSHTFVSSSFLANLAFKPNQPAPDKLM